ncbi:MAG TPA: hypothetical protein VIN39_04545 [Candidatus Dormibacteraeota bacterium]|jgi:hypothetical protein
MTILAFVVVGVLGVGALAVVVAGFLWLLQFVLNNEEARLPRR